MDGAGLIPTPLVYDMDEQYEVQQIHYLFFKDLDVIVQVFFFINML